jgi:hypothetical protein
MWAVSIVDERTVDTMDSFLWSMLWPFLWLYRRLAGKSSAFVPLRTERPAQRFRSIREAKEYLASLIAQEAERNGTRLTEVERKMLYFSESGWTLPDMKKVSAEFDRDYDQDQYEEKIASVVRRIQTVLLNENAQDLASWNEALEKLSDGDHYLLVLADAAKPAAPKGNVRILKVALIFLAIAILNFWFRNWIRNH